ncbi:type III restriction endonuclease subunit R [Acinetobacter sp. RIT592]|jgi:type III restriction enzyme|nr:type III restriction endonuclease subunit R [Acinetobacter sp. RIT592]
MSNNLKLKFDKNQDYQLKAIRSIVNIFDGQERKKSAFSAIRDELAIQGAVYEQEGIGNKLDLKDIDILENIHKIQLANGLTKSAKSEIKAPYNFSVEMETGTGKTYVFTRTIFELNAQYGFRKFIIVVPSVAIREGIKKSLEITAEHFSELYPGVGCKSFIYDSSKLKEVSDFATSDDIQIMIINIDAFRKDFDEEDTKSNLIYRTTEDLSGKKPIELIQQTNPIVIIDEPQSVDNTERSKEAIEKLNPMCILRYSATHKKIQNLVYRLDPVDAFEQKLVKKIEVWSVRPEEDFNMPYIKVLDVYNKNGVYADLEVDVKGAKGKVTRKKIKVKTHDDLQDKTKRDLYSGYVISNLDYNPENKVVYFENQEPLKVGESIGDINNDEVKYQQIKTTIKAHLDKELSLIKKDIKVLSLFFIDEVKNYQIYNEDKTVSKGKYQIMFEQAYNELISKSKYKPLLSSKIRNIQDAERVKGAYFAEDAKNKGKLKDSKERKSGFSADDVRAFDLIMKRKELLLSFDSSVRFIFSHSALKEGWDNPNVFQICTLVDTKDTFTKRQKIGRGLRLAVNQDGERVTHQKDETVNVLTVIANESYEEFASTLQSEIQEECGIKFGHLEENAFQNIVVYKDDEDIQLGYEASKEIFEFMVDKGYISSKGASKGKINESLKRAIVDETVEVPPQYEGIKEEIINVIKKSTRRLPIENTTDKVVIKPRKEVLLSPEFKDLWDRIKQKTTYRVKFDDELFISECLEKMDELRPRRSKINIDRVDIEIKRKGVEVDFKDTIKQDLQQRTYRLPDIIREIQDATMITRSTIIDILLKADKWELFKLNPHQFIEKTIKIFNSVKRDLIVKGIKYEKTDDYYEQSQFDVKEEDALVGYLEKNAISTSDENPRSLYNHVLYDSDVEKNFVERLEKDEEVKLYVKLPGWFEVDTPLGGYNPDWAILMEKDDVKKLYFVIETKGSLEDDDLRRREKDKIRCAKKHFKVLESDVLYEVATDFDDVKDMM